MEHFVLTFVPYFAILLLKSLSGLKIFNKKSKKIFLINKYKSKNYINTEKK